MPYSSDIMPLFKPKTESEETRIRTFRDPERRREKRVTLYTLDYNETRQEYELHETITTFSELPPDAVHVTGEKNAYLLDRVRAGQPSTGITASDLYLFLVNNSINDALAVNWSSKPLDLRRYAIYGIAGIILVCVVWAMM